MPDDDLLAHAVRLTSSVEALAALAAHARVEAEGIVADPLVRSLLAAISAELLGSDDPISSGAATPAIGMARAFLRSATDLVENPGRRGNWDVLDAQHLQGVGKLSGAIVQSFVAAEEVLDGLSTMLRSEGAAILDVGTGTGWLAIALARTYPGARVVGLDVLDAALDLARQNLVAERLGDRVELRLLDVLDLDDEASYDAVWLPLPFLPADVVPGAISVAVRALKPGGWLLPGTFAGPDDRLSQLLLDLRTARSGGHPWTADQVIGMMSDGGLSTAGEVSRTWVAPVRLFAGRVP